MYSTIITIIFNIMAIGSVIRSRIAVIGSGPAGFYTAHQLIKVFLDSYTFPYTFGIISVFSVI